MLETTLLLALAPTLALPRPADDAPRELGRVAWGRSLEEGLARSRAEGKPVFLLFQEVPGCATCVGFGAGPLSHPLVVEAIEELFVPVAIHNNAEGADAEALRRFGEPAWNNPVVRFVDANGKDLIERQDGVYASGAVVARMVRALAAAERPVPPWLALLADDLAADDEQLETAVFAMHCFWEGEAVLGGIDGVTTTRPGHHDGREVVAVRFKPEVVTFDELLSRASAAGVCDRWYKDESATASRALWETVRDADPSDRTYHLGRSPLRFLPLAPLQARRVNADLAAGADPSRWLSPRQRALVEPVHAQAERLAASGLARPDDALALAAYAAELEAALARGE